MPDDHAPDHRFAVTANGRTIEPGTSNYGDAVAVARSHAFRTGERTQVTQHERLHAGRIREMGTRWRSDREGGFSGG